MKGGKATAICIAAFYMAGILMGCTKHRPGAEVHEAMNLVEQRTGKRPDWSAAWSGPASTQLASVLTQQEALSAGLLNNRELRADLETIAQADADLLQAGLFMNPMLNFMIMFPDGGGRSMLRANGLPMIPLQDLWMIPSRKKAAKAQLQQTVLRVADRAIGIAADVHTVYARLQYTQRARELIRDNMQVVDQSTRIIRARLAAGEATQVEANMSQVRYLKLKSELIGLDAEHRRAQRELLMLMGVAEAGDGWTVEPIGDPKAQTLVDYDETELLSLAVEMRLDLKAAEWEILAAQHEIDQMHAEIFKRLSVGLGLERAAAMRSNNQKLAGRVGNIAAGGLTDRLMGMPSTPMPMAPFEPKMRQMDWMLGPMLDMELPLFDQNQARIAKAESIYRQRTAQYESLAQEVTRMVRDKLVMLKQAQEQVAFYRDSVMPLVEQNLDVARRSYIAGKEELTVYLGVQEDLLMTRLKELEFYRDYLIARAELEREVGGRLEVPSLPTTRPAGSQPE